MAELRIESWTMPGADLGSENPLPPLGTYQEAHIPQEIPGIPQQLLQNMAYGRVASILPYTVQDGYTRHLRPRTFRVAVLENKILRATFLLELGGNCSRPTPSFSRRTWRSATPGSAAVWSGMLA